MPENQVVQLLQAIVTELRAIARSETVVGTPVTVGQRAVVPITKVSVGFGAGGGEGTKDKSSGFGGGGGGGVLVEPAAFLVLDPDRVYLLPMRKHGVVDTILEAAPDLLEAVKGWSGKKAEKPDKKEAS